MIQIDKIPREDRKNFIAWCQRELDEERKFLDGYIVTCKLGSSDPDADEIGKSNRIIIALEELISSLSDSESTS